MTPLDGGALPTATTWRHLIHHASSVDRHQKTVLFVGVVLLVYAVLCALSGSIWRTNIIFHIYNWYYHYGEGYINRGLMGTLARLFFGDTGKMEPNELIRWLIPTERWLISVEIFLVWLLLVPKIALTKQFSPITRWLLMSFTAVLLLSPIWKYLASFTAAMDKWIYLFILAAIAALIFKRPMIFSIFMVMSILVHRGGVFFTGILILMAWHAAWRLPAFQRQRRTWFFAGLVPLLIFPALALLHDSNRVWSIILKSKAASLLNESPPDGAVGLGAASGGIADIIYIIDDMLLFPQSALLGFLLFAGPPLFLALLFSWVSSHANLRLGDTSPPSALAQYADSLLAPIMTALPLPIIFFAFDWSRFFYWCWLSLTLAFIYHVWYYQSSQASDTKRNKRSLKITAAAVVFIAGTYAGTPLLIAWIDRPFYNPCKRWCSITEHHWGIFITRALHKALIQAPFPLQFNIAERQHRLNSDDSLSQKLSNRGKHSSFYSNDNTLIFSKKFLLYELTRFFVEVTYNGTTPPPLEFQLNAETIPPTKIDNHGIQWSYTIPYQGGNQYYFDIHALGGENYELVSLYMNATYLGQQ